MRSDAASVVPTVIRIKCARGYCPGLRVGVPNHTFVSGLVRDEDGVTRPASLEAGAHPRDVHEKSVVAETLFELPVVPRGPDSQRSAGTECGKGSGDTAIVVEPCVVGGRERR